MDFLSLLSGVHDNPSGFTFETKHFAWALAMGGLSAISLPLGSALGLLVQPRKSITAAMTAFGGGALLAALAIELVAPATHALAGGEEHAREELLYLILGMVGGGVLFFLLDNVVNEKGGFLRKTATTISYLSRRKEKEDAGLLDELSKVELLRFVPTSDVRHLVEIAKVRTFADKHKLFEEGEAGDSLYIILAGKIGLAVKDQEFKELHDGEILGEIALMTGAPRNATAVCHGEVKCLVLEKHDFDDLRRDIPELEMEIKMLAGSRLTELRQKAESEAQVASNWYEAARDALSGSSTDLPTPSEIKKAKEEHSGAPLAIWLGILLDGIPESFVIGASFLGVMLSFGAAHGGLEHVSLGDVVPYTLIAGLFLSNFPEAMGSSIGMRAQGWGKFKILFMWIVLMVITAFGSWAGFTFGEHTDPMIVVATEGLAAGAMLTMIASTMVPEAVHLGGAKIAGMGTLAGFLAAIAFKFFEG